MGDGARRFVQFFARELQSDVHAVDVCVGGYESASQKGLLEGDLLRLLGLFGGKFTGT